MTQYKGARTLYDDFNDASISSTRYTNITGADVTETTSSNVEDQTAYPGLITKTSWNVSSGIVAIKWLTPTGTNTATTSMKLGLIDSSNREIGIEMLIGSAGHNTGRWYTVGGPAVADTAVFPGGLGTDLANGEWIGLGRMGSGGGSMGCYKSLDGTNWWLYRKTTYTGSFTYSAAKQRFAAGHTDSNAVKSWFLHVDEQSTVTLTPKMKVRVGSSWVEAVPKVRVGTSWVTCQPLSRNGGSWT